MNRTAISDLGRALRLLGQYGDDLSQASATPETLEQIRNDLIKARGLLDTVAQPAPTTKCSEHPQGPTEPGTDGECLLCGIRSTRASRADSDDVSRSTVAGVINQLGTDAALRMYGPRAVAAATVTARRTSHLNPGVRPEAADA
ncbi:hypothetical protein AB0912_15365 [Streptomyces sp. NPDC007084]|uniref:hypothetical protein n=1 Tax=Streptomyces sp. NPDC007084 TaxID=3154313 RepID=UPI0034558946